jgi:hypothetical protein
LNNVEKPREPAGAQHLLTAARVGATRLYWKLQPRWPKAARWYRRLYLSTLASLSPPEPRGKVVLLFASPRSGSNYLLDCLRTTGVRMVAEPLEPNPAFGYSEPASGALAHLSRVARINGQGDVGFTLLLQGLLRNRLWASQISAAFPAALSLVLYRTRLLAQFVSLLLVKRSGIFHTRTSDVSHLRDLHFNPQAYLEWRNYTALAYDTLIDLAPHALVSYEDLTDPAQDRSSSLASQLGLSSDRFRSSLRKLAHRDPLQHLSNPGDAEAFGADRLVARWSSGSRARFVLEGVQSPRTAVSDPPPGDRDRLLLAYERALDTLNAPA